jgi:ribonuclease P protein component
VARYGFPGRYKLLKTDEFSSVFSFRRRIFGECLAMYYKPNSLGYARLGIVVSKKTARRAVARNYMRRVLREWFRLNREKLGGLDVVVKVQKPFMRTEFNLTQEELLRFLNRLQRESAKVLEKIDGARANLAG